MSEVTTLINLHAENMGQVLGYSHGQVLADCTIRELLLYVGTVEAMTPTKAGADTDSDDAAFDAQTKTAIASIMAA